VYSASSLIASWLGPRLPRRTTYFAAFAVAEPPPFIALALDLPVWSVMVVYCVAGLASGLLNPMIGAMLFERIPRPLLGRVGALADALAWSAMPLGGLVAAALIALTGLAGALGVAAAGYALAIALPALATRSSFEPPAPAEPGESAECVPLRQAG
jgi:MFS family permease